MCSTDSRGRAGGGGEDVSWHQEPKSISPILRRVESPAKARRSRKTSKVSEYASPCVSVYGNWMGGGGGGTGYFLGFLKKSLF
jgi:hypothetical protein